MYCTVKALTLLLESYKQRNQGLTVKKEIKTLEVDTEKKIFKLNGIDFGKGCEEFVISCTGGEGFKIRMELSKRIIYANYGTDNTLESEPEVIEKTTE